MVEVESVNLKMIKIPFGYIRNDPGNVTQLSASMRRGMIYPIVVDMEYNLVDGLRRLEAAKRRHRRRIKVLKIDVKDEWDRLEIQIMLALQRKDISPIEKGKAFKRMADHYQISLRELARRISVSKSQVEYHVKLLELPGELQEKLQNGDVKPYALERMIYRNKIKNIEQFKAQNATKQMFSIINRITTLAQMVVHVNFELKDLIRIKERISLLEKNINDKIKKAEEQAK